jgi:hypothetical protein
MNDRERWEEMKRKKFAFDIDVYYHLELYKAVAVYLRDLGRGRRGLGFHTHSQDLVKGVV